MKVLIFNKTQDSDLYKGLQVAYHDKSGEYTQTGEIAQITEQDGKKVYIVNGAAYLADELKLIGNSKAVKVIFIDPQYNYITSVNPCAPDESLIKYFVGTTFNIGSYPEEIMKKCISIEII